MKELLFEYLNLLIKLRIYPFAPLEINFMINFFWVILKNILKAKAEYRFSQGILSFFEFKIINFILSFLVMFAIYVSLDFWLKTLELNSLFLMLLPSLAAIVLAEFSSLLAGFFYQPKEDLSFEEKEIEKSTKELSIYFAISFLSLMLFWSYMAYNYLLNSV